ncbi:MAG: L,D-transpeptidase [Candidatus Velamenicoccus archaeovorus]
MRIMRSSPGRTLGAAVLAAATLWAATGGPPAASGAEPTLRAAIPPVGRLVLERVSTAAIRAAAEPEGRLGPRPALLVDLRGPLRATAEPGGGRVVGILPPASRYYHVPLVAWVRRTDPTGRFGLVQVPYGAGPRSGWIPLRGLRRHRTPIRVRVDLSRHELTVTRWGRTIARFPAATGAAVSPTPPGRYFVTDRVPFPRGSSLGSFAFGISGIQPHLPAGWSGGDQLAIHGTNAPSTIGTSASAGCVRVSEAALARLRPLLELGTPVVIVP